MLALLLAFLYSPAGACPVQRSILFDLRDEIVPPTNETVAQVFARISAYRDSMDGPQFDDQGLLNTDPRFIAVPG